MERNRKNKRRVPDKAIPANRLKAIAVTIMCVFALLTIRLAWIQFVQGAELKERASRQQTLNKTITPRRGSIYDANGKALAISSDVDTISINPSKIVVEHEDKEVARVKTEEYKKKVAEGLAEIFSLDYDEVFEKVNSDKSTETIAEKVDKELVDKLKAWQKENKITAGINIDATTKRNYPYGSVASHVVGFTGTDSQGLFGVEEKWDSTLTGVAGKIVTTGNVNREEISEENQQYVEVENGSDLYLTIDVNIQKIAEQYLQKGVDDNNATAGSVILMDPKAGDILAMATYPNYNLNEPFTINNQEDQEKWAEYTSEERKEKLQNMWVDRNFKTYEPGSTFKLLISSIALEEEITGTDVANDFHCEGVTIMEDDTKIGCAGYEVHGNQSLRGALRNSCNAAFIQLGERIGATRMYKYFEAFGLFERTGVGISGETPSIFHELEKVGPVERAVTSFGQRFNITPLQLITAVSSIANDGKLVQPRVVKKVVNTDNGTVTEMETKEIRKVISEDTAKEIRDMMKTAVENRESVYGSVKGYTIGGKTGTSEPPVNDPDSGYVVSYIAIAPADEPKVVGLVIVYNPGTENPYGSRIAAPILSNILTEVLPYMGIASENSDTSAAAVTNVKTSKVPDVTNKTLAEAKKNLENLGFKVEMPEGSNANSELVTEQMPERDTSVVEGGTVVLYTAINNMRTSVKVPNFVRKEHIRSKKYSKRCRAKYKLYRKRKSIKSRQAEKEKW